MHRSAPAALLATVLTAALLTLGSPGQETAIPVGEARALERIARNWIDLGRWCAARDLGEEARDCAARARAVWPETSGLEGLQEKAADCPDDADPADRARWERKRASTAKRVASQYDRLFAAGTAPGVAAPHPRHEEYLWTAVALDPSSARWRAVGALVERALGDKEVERGVRLAERAQTLDPPEELIAPLRAAVDAAAVDRVLLRTATRHPIRYYLSLPRGYQHSAERRWPVLLAVDGAGSNFQGMANGYREDRKDLPFIVVAPCTFSSTNRIEGSMLEKYRNLYSDEVIEEGNSKRLEWDEAGVLAILQDLRESYNAEDRVYVTGFSGGGNVTYMMIFRHPDLVAGAAPTCANFGAPGYGNLKGKFSPEDLNFPIQIFTGAEDPHRDFTFGDPSSPGIEPQTDWAQKVLEELGYPNWKRTLVPGLKHSPARDHVIALFTPYWLGERQRADPLPD